MRVIVTLLLLIGLAVLMSGVGGFLLLSQFFTLISPSPSEAGAGNIFRLGYFALMFFGSLAILIRVGLLARTAMGGTAPVHSYMREAAVYGVIMLVALGTSCWLVAEWARQIGRR